MPEVVAIARSTDVTLSRSVCNGDVADAEVVEGWELVLTNRGAFRREIEDGVAVVDPTVVYLGRPRQAHRIHHVGGCGDAGEVVFLSARFAEVYAERIPVLPFAPGAAAVLAARALVAAARGCQDDLALDEAVSRLLELLVEDAPPMVRDLSRGRRAVVVGVLERLAHEIESGSRPASLPSLAADAGYSPHHLCRAFRAVTGTTISRHRRALRARAALARIEDGAGDLSAVAAEVGLVDHSHLVRTMRAELGTTPSELRRLLGVARI